MLLVCGYRFSRLDRKSAMGLRSVVVAAGVLLAAAGCVSTGDLDSLRGDVNQLKRESFELKKETSELKKHAARSVKEDSFDALRESQASLYSQVNEQSKELQVLQGRFDEYRFQMDKTMKDNAVERDLLRSQVNSLAAQVKALSEKIAMVGETKPAVAGQKPAAEEDVGKAAQQDRSGEGDPGALYEAAYNAFREKKYKDARQKFGAFIKKFPNESLAGNAQYWTGECYFAEKDYENAILSFETVIKHYPHSEKIPTALLKQGLSFAALGDQKTAKVIFDKIIEKYPDSREAGIAKKKKAETEKRPPKKGKR
ncbi:MAG: tol-pal system protein YbgF [Nitrospirae bacterium]|nr:tol-pal system protein YbgF [Nitrospirota bacterium]